MIFLRLLKLIMMVFLSSVTFLLVTCSTILFISPDPSASEARADCQLDYAVEEKIVLCMEDFFKASSIIPTLSIVGYALSILTLIPLVIYIYRKFKKIK